MISQKFQDSLARRGISWVPTVEMDSLELIERYVEEGYGIGVSVRVPHKKLHSRIQVIELPDFPTLRLGMLYRVGPSPGEKLRDVFIEEVRRQAAAQVDNYLQQTQSPTKAVREPTVQRLP